jgi:hypothetical protein
MSELDWQRRIAAIERHVDTRMDTLEAKLDAILRHLTGYRNS